MRLLSTRQLISRGERARIVANLPYNIATPLLVGWLTAEPWPPWYDALVLMFQREVAERIVAPPGGKSYGRLSVLAGWRSEAKIVFDVAPVGFRAAAERHLVGGAARPARGAACLRYGRSAARHPGCLRPAPQDAAAEPEIAGHETAKLLDAAGIDPLRARRRYRCKDS